MDERKRKLAMVLAVIAAAVLFLALMGWLPEFENFSVTVPANR